MPPSPEHRISLSSLPDEYLARRVSAGDVNCFDELLARYRDRVYRICYRCSGNSEDAADWAQECLVRAFRNIGSYDPARPFAPWMLRLVSNTCVNLAKARARRRERLELGWGQGSEAAALTPAPLDRVIVAEEERLALRAVEALPPELRVAVVLRVLEDLTFMELSEALGIPLQTAATRVRRALERVREQLARERQ